jgi:hypothetical protein
MFASRFERAGSIQTLDGLRDQAERKRLVRPAQGIGPGCESAAGSAVPPVRIRAVAEALAPGERRLYSICDADLGPALGSIAEGILAAAQN